MAHERNEGERIYSAGVDNGRFHRPDLIVLGDLPEAIEVELSDKSNRRLDEILKGWRWAVLEKKISRVRYLCSPRALRYVTRVVERMPMSDWIEMEHLEERAASGCTPGLGRHLPWREPPSCLSSVPVSVPQRLDRSSIACMPDELNERSDVFIAHASEDKDNVARPLAQALTDQGWSVWLDELKLTVGDSLSGRIETALADTRFGVVILSPAFFAKEWPKRELAGLAAREIDAGAKVILPVWHNVDHAYILQHSPVLADRLGTRTSTGIDRVAHELALALRGSRDSESGPVDIAEQDVQIENDGDGPSLFSIPTTADQQTKIIEEQPEWWEYRLYAGALMRGRLELEDKWHAHELSLPGGRRREPDAMSDFLSRELGWMQVQISAIDRVFDPDVLERAFGARGEPGDAERIKQVAQGVIQIYASMMEWAAELRNTSAPGEYAEVVEQTARMVDGPVRQIHDFVQQVADEIARIPILTDEAEKSGATEDNPMTLTLTLTLSVDEGVQEKLQAALRRLG
jgi:TIR domain